MRFAYVLLLLACRASVSIAAGQVISAPASSPGPVATGKTYPVSGTVFNTATNEPVSRALVHLNGGRGEKVAFTGADGRFLIDDVPEGQILPDRAASRLLRFQDPAHQWQFPNGIQAANRRSGQQRFSRRPHA